MNIELTVDLQTASVAANIPQQMEFDQWVAAALQHPKINKQQAEVSIRIVDETEGQDLNNTYRQKDYATNVLSFPCDLPEEVELPLLGDLVICAPVVNTEAGLQNKDLNAHWAHMVIHGTLHLCGFDHINDSDAEVMESMEVSIMDKLGLANPYLPTE